jgi:hypothetical protein
LGEILLEKEKEKRWDVEKREGDGNLPDLCAAGLRCWGGELRHVRHTHGNQSTDMTTEFTIIMANHNFATEVSHHISSKHSLWQQRARARQLCLEDSGGSGKLVNHSTGVWAEESIGPRASHNKGSHQKRRGSQGRSDREQSTNSNQHRNATAKAEQKKKYREWHSSRDREQRQQLTSRNAG